MNVCNRTLYLGNHDRYEQTDIGDGLVGLDYPWGGSNRQVVGTSVGRGGKGERGGKYR